MVLVFSQPSFDRWSELNTDPGPLFNTNVKHERTKLFHKESVERKRGNPTQNRGFPKLPHTAMYIIILFSCLEIKTQNDEEVNSITLTPP